MGPAGPVVDLGPAAVTKIGGDQTSTTCLFCDETFEGEVDLDEHWRLDERTGGHVCRKRPVEFDGELVEGKDGLLMVRPIRHGRR